jgi:hypothetical protein
MITKREAELIEQIVWSMTGNEYWNLVGWLSGGGEGPLWQPRPRRSALPTMKTGVGEANPALSLSAKQSTEAADGR